MLRVLSALLVIGLVVTACGGDASGGGGGGGEAGVVPVGSTVIFGTAYDPGTIGAVGKAQSLPAGSPMFAVGKALARHPPSEVSVEVTSGGSKLAPSITASNDPESANVFAADLTPLGLSVGSWVVRFKVGANIIASGTLTITP